MPSHTEDTGIKVNNQKILRDEKGRYLKGTPAPFKGGRRKTGFKDRLNELVGEDSRDIALVLCEMAFYNQKEHKDRWARYKPADQLKALELILKYKEQMPPQKIEAQVETKNITVTIDAPADIDISKI